MDVQLACGDNNVGEDNIDKITENPEVNQLSTDNSELKDKEINGALCSEGKPRIAIDHDKNVNLKDRIANCRKVIETLKLELSEEKAKLQEESKSSEVVLSDSSPAVNNKCYTSNMPTFNKYVSDAITRPDTNYLYSTSVDSKLCCDDTLMEYEKQLQRYQDTLTMAQTEKKNAIRKQMLTKVYKLKLLEVENQCNIELLRVKQSLQCLEPLQMIVNKWKINDNNATCDLNSYELIPRYPESNAIATNEVNIFTDDEKSEFIDSNEDP